VVAALAEGGAYDVIHLNDWHTGLVPALAGGTTPTVITIHNLAHQGWSSADWLHRLPVHRDHYGRHGQINMLAGAIATADAVVTVSPTYAGEIVTPDGGCGLDDILRRRGDDLHGIRNGIDTTVWDPARDPHLHSSYSMDDLDGKEKVRAALLDELGWADDGAPIVGMVTRLVDQKGIDLALEAARILTQEGRRIRVVSLPCLEQFQAQPPEYRERVLPADAPRLLIEAGVEQGLALLLRPQDRFHGMQSFGASAPHKTLAKNFGFTAEAVLEHARSLLA